MSSSPEMPLKVAVMCAFAGIVLMIVGAIGFPIDKSESVQEHEPPPNLAEAK